MQSSNLRREIIFSLVICAAAVMLACGRSKIEGTYSSASGTMILELRPAGKASFLMMGEAQDCTYTVKEKNIHLTCGSNETDFHIMDDGSLSSSSPLVGATFGVLRKTK